MDRLSETQISEFEEAFYLLDQDGDGRITINELGTAIKSLNLNPTERELRNMIKEVDDINGNNGSSETIGFGDFLNLMAIKMKEVETEDELKEAFKVFDRDQDGYISPIELKNVMKELIEKVSNEEIEQMIKVADLDGDGLLNFQEFHAVMSFI